MRKEEFLEKLRARLSQTMSQQEVTGGNQFKLSHKSYSFIISSSNVLMVNRLFSSIA